jgi:outer membrane protein insertion porin family
LRKTLALFLAAAGMSAWAFAGGAPGAAGATIESVSYRCDGEVSREEVARLMDVHAGDSFDPDTIRRSVQDLYATEWFSDIVVTQSPGKGRGIALVFDLYRAYRVADIGFAGNPVGKESLRQALGFHTGQPYLQSEVQEGAGRIERFLATEGYAQVGVEPRTAFDRARFEANITYVIAPGPPTRVSRPIFDGEIAPFSIAQLTDQTRLRQGDRYREEKARADARRIQAFLLSQGRLKAEVTLIGVDTDGGKAAPVYRIEVGPLVRFETRGVEEKRVQKDFQNLLKDQVFQEDLLLDYVSGLRRGYQAAGYHEAKVEYRIDRSPAEYRVLLTVDKGPRFFVQKIDIEGVHAFPEARIRKLLLTRPRSLFHRGYLVDSVLDEDRSAIEGFYVSHGFIQAKVPAPETAPGTGAGALVVRIAVFEGPQTIVTARRIEGVFHVDPASLAKLLRVRVGIPLNGQDIADDRAAIAQYYHDRGWVEAAVEPEISYSDGRRGASVIYRITEGEREFFGKTIIRGNTRTRIDRIRIPIGWVEGDPYSDTRVLEARRELARTGVFQKVEIRPALPDPTTTERNLLVDVSEGRPLSLLYGVGYQYEATTGDQGPFGLLGIGYNNLAGSLSSISFEGRYAPTTGRGRLYLNYRDPYFFGLGIPFTASVFYAREPIQRIDVTRRGAFVEGTRRLTDRLQAGVRVEYQKIEVGSGDPLDLQQLQPFDRNIKESTVGLNLIYEGRDDPIDPHEGVFATSFVKYAFPAGLLATETKFVKLYGQISAYHRFLGGVVAASVRAGRILTPSGLDDSSIPIAERFFSGGRTSNRGFDTEVEGIPGETVDYTVIETPVPADKPGTGDCGARIDPTGNFNCDFGPRIVGGSVTAGWNLEWRFPIAGALGGTVFYDATQVWANGDIHFGIEGQRGLRQSIGVGLRYRTPVGPIRFEYGRILRPQTFTVPIKRRDPLTGVISDVPEGEVNTASQAEHPYRIFLSIGYPF